MPKHPVWRCLLLCLACSSGLRGQSDSSLLNERDLEELQVHVLELKRALPMDGVEVWELSGLTMCNGTLFAVSDTDDGRIFKISVSGEKAVLDTYVEFAPPPMEGLSKLDLEGLTCDDQGNFYMVSESACRILKVPADVPQAIWITPTLLDFGFSKQLFQRRNAYLEGVALVGGDEFMLAAERENRGLLHVKLSPVDAVEAFDFPVGRLAIPEHRSPDLSDLAFADNQLYGLIRAASAVCRLDWEGGQVKETECWSFEAIESLPELQYEDMQYGRAEGLAIDGDTIYIVLDDNQQARKLHPNDFRPLLLIMKREGPPQPSPATN